MMSINCNGGKIIVLGGGSRGIFFIRMLVTKIGREVAAIVDNYVEGHDAIRYRLKEAGINDIPLYCSLEEALEHTSPEEVNILFMMTPEWTHLDLFRKAIGSGFHVFLEKPIATTPEDCKDIYNISITTDKIVQVGFVLRYSPFYQRIKQIVKSGKLGKILVIQMNERMTLQHGTAFKRLWHRLKKYTGGFINEKCCHDIDLMCWMMENQASPCEVFSLGGIGFSCHKNTPLLCAECDLDKCPWRDIGVDSLKNINGTAYFDATSAGIGKCVFHSDADVYDHQTVNIRFADGSHGIFTAVAMSGKHGRDILIHGTDGYLEGSLEEGIIKYTDYWSNETEIVELGDLDPHGGGDYTVVSEFLKCIGSGIKPISTVEDGLRASLIAFAADKSVATGLNVKL